MERQFRDSAARQEEAITALQKQRKRTESLIQDCFASYKREQAILDKVLFYSQGTVTENEARFRLEDAYQEEEGAKRAFEEGSEELERLVNEHKTALTAVEDSWTMWKIDQLKEETHAEN